jgi:diguanylate cyclase (GGDEF)-like protein
MPVTLPSAHFERLFPGYVRFDETGKILSAGSSLRRLLGEQICGQNFLNTFEVETPRRVSTVDLLTDEREVTVKFQLSSFEYRMRGFVLREKESILLLLGHIPDTDAAQGASFLTMADFSPADGCLDLLVANEVRQGLLQETKALVAELKERTAEAEELANLDQLTGLINRRGFLRKLDEMLQEARLADKPFTVGLIDLDGFKAVNDVFGHAAGDQVLEQSGARIRGDLVKGTIVGRMGGDEFGLIIPGVSSEEALQELGSVVCGRFAEPFLIREGVARIGASIGFASFPNGAESAGALMEYADYALYHAKQEKGGNSVIFTADHQRNIRHRLKMERLLMEADDDEFYLVYQPIIRSEDGTMIGLEALARWTSPVLGEIGPDTFIRLAEQSGHVARLTLLLLKKALRDALTWPTDLSLSFNLSAIDLASAEAAKKIAYVVAASGFATERLQFEITETAMLRDIRRAQESLAMFTSMGIRIALDDFGTGYSSLNYLWQMPIDRLKIDCSFTQEIELRKDVRNIVQSVITLCRDLGIDCVVEGVSSNRQAALLKRMRAPLQQGFYFSEPMRSDEVLAMIGADNSGRPVSLPLVPAAIIKAGALRRSA